MNREQSNRIRWFIEDVIPPFVSDSRLFAWLMACAYSPVIYEFARFRTRAHHVTRNEYDAIYRSFERIQDSTDNSVATLEAIAEAITSNIKAPYSIADIGCGSGYTLNWLHTHLPPEKRPDRLVGVDFQISEKVCQKYPHITFQQADIESLPFEDRAFDVVLCTHTLEHILDIRAAISELRRICARKLILVVPREREKKYTFNLHLHFFPYLHSFLKVLHPLPPHYTCLDIQRDIFYMENIQD